MNKEEEKASRKAYRQANPEKIKAQKKAYRQANVEKIKASSKVYLDLNREKHNARSRAYYAAHLEERRAWSKIYRETHREKLKIAVKAWQKLHREDKKIYDKAYQAANIKKIRARGISWRKRNPIKCREGYRRRRALKYKTQIEPISEKVVFMRDGWICQICTKRVDKRFKYPNPKCASLDHIIPLSKGGSHTYANIQLAHFGCNMSKHDRTLPQGEQMRLF